MRNKLIPPDALSSGMKYFESVTEIKADTALLAYVRVVECAWKDFNLDGILCIDNIPAVYLRQVDEPLSDKELNDLHRRFWNQGIAQTLIVGDPKTVRIFSGLATPQKPETPLCPDSPSLVTTLSLYEFSQRAVAFCQATANGSWYLQNPDKYKTGSSVDSYLLENLVELHNDLTKARSDASALETQTANALIGRILFVCYLVDREIVELPRPFSGMKLHEALKRIVDDSAATEFLYNFFSQLKEDFNGSMFDQNLEEERAFINPFHIQQIRHFLDGQKIGSSQHNLGFWAYDFRLIPVETISAIYEEFLAYEDPGKKRETGAFYTPRFLAEMTIDVAVEGRRDWHALRYLDPCCGSGIFLVTIFNRIANKWNLDNPGCDDYLTKVDALKDILKQNVRGVDLNPTACRLACFSLYIAFLDSLSPSDIKTYVLLTKHKLPYLIAGNETSAGTECIPVVSRADFLHDNDLPKMNFDCVIGNPPWQGRSSKQLAIKILQHIEHHLVPDGEGCLLLPSKVFLNAQTNKFQFGWLKQVTVERVVQLADYSFVLFEQALCPAMIVRYRNQSSNPSHRIAYDTPKFHPSARRRGLITISSQDHKWLSQAQIRESAKNESAPVVWKRSLWGTGRDLRLLEYLRTFPLLSSLAGDPQEGKRWIKGQGFQPNTSGKSKKPQKPWWNPDALFISARAQNLQLSNVLLEKDCEKIGQRFGTLHRSRDPRIYKAPLILVSQGFQKIVYSYFDVLFQHSLQSISGPPGDENLLLFLTAYLSSSLAKFYLFHTAANWGTERDKVHLEELLTLPFPLPEDSPANDAAGIIREVADRMRKERDEQELVYNECLERNRQLHGFDEQRARKEWLKRRKERTLTLQTKLEPLVHRYFGLHGPEVMLLEDTMNVSIPSSTPSKAKADRFDLPTLQSVGSCRVKGYMNGLAVYAETLANTLNSWAVERGSDFRVRPSGGVDNDAGVAMVTLELGKKCASMINLDIAGNLSQPLKQGLEASTRQSLTIRSERELFWFERECIHIIRPATLVHWTRTAALNDADTIYGEIAMARRHENA